MFTRILMLALTLLAWPAVAADGTTGEAAERPQVLFETSLGPVTIELYPDRAPATVENFLAYVDSGFYDGTLFHRIVPSFVVQGGGFDTRYEQKPTRKPIANEAGNGLANRRGTLSMARTADPNSATSQFFINLVDNRSLNRGPGGAGYAVFGEVTKGMEIVDQMAAAPQGAHRGLFSNAPNEPIVILRAKRVAPAKPAAAPAPAATPKTKQPATAEP